MTSRPGQRPVALTGPAIGLAIGAMFSMQMATALSRPLSAEIGAPALTLLRMAAAAAILVALTRPRFTGLSRAAVGASVLLGSVLGLMSLATFAAVTLLPIGLVAAISFLGPLSVALIGPNGLRTQALGFAALAALGLFLMLAPTSDRTSSGWAVDPLGVVYALLAAVGWALYILLTGRVGALCKGNDGLCLSLLTAAVILLPVGMNGLAGADHPAGAGVILGAAALGILAPTMTCWLELKALRVLGNQSFGILMSLEPAIAALLGLVILHEIPSLVQMTGVTCVIIACSGAVRQPGQTTAHA